MKISLEWVSDFVDLPDDLKVEDLAHELTLKTVEVEDHIDSAAALAHVLVGQVTALKDLGERGYLLATCDIGGSQVSVVTRAGNLAVGLVTAVALPGARLGAADSGGLRREVTAATVGGVASEGVIGTAANLGLEKLFPRNSNTALDLSDLDLAIGSQLADELGWNDHILEIDNKSLTNRPDLWGHYGIARELAAIYERELKPLTGPGRHRPQVDGLIDAVDPALCQRIATVGFTLDHDSPAPLWLRSRLARIGEGTVNLCVDLSNYVMFTVGQPTHVYDADRITPPLSVVANQGTTELELLTGETKLADSLTPVIRDANGPVAVAGIMGVASSAVTAGSRRFILEAATFRPDAVRRASQRLSVRTEASARFEKGLDTQRVDRAIDLFCNLLGDVAPDAGFTGGQDVVIDPTPTQHIDVDLSFLAKRIGQAFGITEIHRTLASLGFEVTTSGDTLRITAPTWRSTGDISLPHDIVEEVARIHGYDNIPVAPLSVALKPLPPQNRRPLDRMVREQLASRAGMQEVVTYPWVADRLLAAAGLSKEDTVRFEGAPAPDRDSLRPALLPNVLETVAANLRYIDAFAIFEVGTVFLAGSLVPYRGIFEPMPRQPLRLAAALVGTDGPALFGRAKGVLEMLRRHCHLTDLRYTDTAAAPWADHSARLGLAAQGVDIGTLGLLTTKARRHAGIDQVHVACFELDLGLLSAHPSRDNLFEPIPELPGADFDLSVVVADSTRWTDISAAVAGVNDLISQVAFIDEFRGSWVPNGYKSMTLRVTLQPTTTTLTADTIAAARAEILAALERQLDAHLRE